MPREKSLIRFSSQTRARASGHVNATRHIEVADVFYAKFPGVTATTSIISKFLVSKVEERRMRIARRRLGEAPGIYRRRQRSRERRGRGLDSSCTVNNTPPGRDRLAHPRHPATIYLLFVSHTFVSWPPLPSAVCRGCLPPRKLEEKDWRNPRTPLPRRGSLLSAESPAT